MTLKSLSWGISDRLVDISEHVGNTHILCPNLVLTTPSGPRTNTDDMHVDITTLPDDKFPSSCEELSQLRPTTPDELMKIIMKSPSKSCSLDPLPTWMLKEHLPVILPKLTDLINISLENGVFPNTLGHAIVTPIIEKK